jgi:phosphatidate cytidylyltransferase
MLLARILTAAAALIVLVGAAWLAPALLFDLILLVIVALALREWMLLLKVRSAQATASACGLVAIGLAGVTAVPTVMAAASGTGVGPLPLYILATLIWLMAVPMSLARLAPLGGHGVAGRFLAFMLCLACWLALIQADGLGKGFLLSVLLLVWVADTAAYFAGRAFGRHKLAPAISPGKTREGVVGAVLANLVLAAGLAQAGLVSSANPAGTLFSMLQINLGWPLMLLITVLLTLVSVAGDLYESLLKRACGVKDSGRLLPGHGGVLDRVDAALAVFPVTMCIVSLIQTGLLKG